MVTLSAGRPDSCESTTEMRTKTLSDRLEVLQRKLGVCGNAGIAVGAVTGLILSVLGVVEEPLEPSLTETIQIWLILALFGWLALLFIFTIFMRWTISSVAIPALANSTLVTALTIVVTRVTGLFSFAWLIGILMGALVGLLLCILYRRGTR